MKVGLVTLVLGLLIAVGEACGPGYLSGLEQEAAGCMGKLTELENLQGGPDTVKTACRIMRETDACVEKNREHCPEEANSDLLQTWDIMSTRAKQMCKDT